MKQILHILFLFLSIATQAQSIDSNPIIGNWIPVHEEMGGKELPKSFFEKQKLIIGDSSYTFYAESIDKGILKYSLGQMDIYGKEGVNSGKHFTAIYKIENDQLSICYNLKGDRYPSNFETKSPGLFFCVFSKEDKK